MKLSVKIIGSVLVVLSVLLFAFAYFIIDQEKQTLSKVFEKNSRIIKNDIKKTISIIYDDEEAFETYLKDIIANYENINYLSVYKGAKRVFLHNDKKEGKYYNSKILDENGYILGRMEIYIDDKDNIKAISNRINHFIILTIIMFVVISVTLIFIIDYFLLSKIERLKNHASVLSSGKYQKHIHFQSKDELEELGNALNHMVDNILSVNGNLAETNHMLEEKAKELKEADSHKNEFLANISHELKTPLNSIIILSSIMSKNKNKNLNDKDIKNVSIINRCGNDLLVLINDILDVSKIESKTISLHLEKFDLKVLISELIDSMSPLIKNKNITLRNSHDLDSLTLFNDKLRLKQILKNLISNAIKFTDEGFIDIQVKDNKKEILIEIIDTGIGISKDKIYTIFDRFKQADGTKSRKYGGAGLGLSISKELINLLGGEIEVISEVSKGSTFKIYIPKKANIKNVSDDMIELAKRDEKSDYGDITLYEEDDNVEYFEEQELQKILVINDNPLLFMNLCIGLKKEQEFEVSQVKDYDEALDFLSSNRDIEIVILEMDNKDIHLEMINELNEDIKIVTISNENEEFEGFITLNIEKSLDSESMIEKIKEVYKGKEDGEV